MPSSRFDPAAVLKRQNSPVGKRILSVLEVILPFLPVCTAVLPPLLAAVPMSLSNSAAGWCCLLYAVISGLWVQNSFTPPQAFFMGVIASEFPFHPLAGHLGLLAVWALDGTLNGVVGFSGGALSTWPGFIALCSFPVICVMYGVLCARQWEARGILQRELQLHDKIAMPQSTSSRIGAWLPVPSIMRANEGLIVETDYEFAEVDGKSLKCDVYYTGTKVAPGSRPVLLYLHGGGWVFGDKRQGASTPILRSMAAGGCVVVSINYRLCPSVDLVGQVEDSKRALAWIRAGKDAFLQQCGASTDFVGVGGESAGGHLALMLSMTQNKPEYQPSLPSTADTRVSYCVDLFGPTDLTDQHKYHKDQATLIELLEQCVMQKSFADHKSVYEAYSPLCLLQQEKVALSAVPPVFSVIGSIDHFVPPQEKRHFYSKLVAETVHNLCLHVELPGGHHGFCGWPSMRVLAVCDAAVAFVKHVELAQTSKQE